MDVIMDVIINIPSEPIMCSICLSSLYTKQNEIEDKENEENEDNEENEENEDKEETNEENIIILSCSHSYHKDCIKSWSYYNHTCPLCRTNIKNKEIDTSLHTENNNQNQNQNLLRDNGCNYKLCCSLLCYILILPILILIMVIFIKYTR